MKNKYEVIGDKVFIYLDRRGKEPLKTVIDIGDFEKVNQIKGKWHVHHTKTGKMYVKATVPIAKTKDKKMTLHRFIMEPPEGMVVDHIDHDRLNNTRSNLRIVTAEENLKNKPKAKHNSSGHKNVRWHSQAGKWQAYKRVDGKFISLGLYEDIEKAVQAVNDFEKR